MTMKFKVIQKVGDESDVGEAEETPAPGHGKGVPALLNPMELVASVPDVGGGFAKNWAQAVELANNVGSQAQALELLRAAQDAGGCLDLLLGGLLSLIREKGWYAPNDTFAEFCAHVCGFRVRKAEYLIRNFEFVVEAGVPWQQLNDVGWTKLREIAARIEPENLPEWLSKAKTMTVFELKEALGAAKADPDQAVTKKMAIPVKVFPDELETIEAAIVQAKEDEDVKHDHQALEGICIAYMSSPAVAQAAKLATVKDACHRLLKKHEGDVGTAVADVLAQVGEVFAGWQFHAEPPVDGGG